MQQQQLLSDLDDLQLSLERWHNRTIAEMNAARAKFTAHIKSIEDFATGRTATPVAVAAVKAKPGGLQWDSLVTPDGSPIRGDNDVRTPSLASPPISHPIHYETLMDEMVKGGSAFSNHTKTAGSVSQLAGGKRSHAGSHNTSAMSDADMRSRPTPDAMLNDSAQSPSSFAPSDRNMPCQVLVEFKRKRILQFESPYYVAPGEYVVVGGDRGEDIGLVTHSWAHGQKGEIPGAGRWNGGVGLGKVLRVANVLEVSQLQGVQTELELRAVDVAQEKVREHQLPMKIVDAEYQFDRKKLTFYYQSQHRLDFRNLVRDLYKTFRARIWMEQDIV
jgi:hypothetical protein